MRFAFVVAVAVLASCADEPEYKCSIVGCESGAQFEVGTFGEPDVARLEGARIEVCIGDECWNGVIDELPAPNDHQAYHLGAPSLEPVVEVSLTHSASGEIATYLRVRSDEADRFADGDVYTIRITDANGAILVNRAWSVTYLFLQPNGERCGPTCRTAETIT